MNVSGEGRVQPLDDNPFPLRVSAEIKDPSSRVVSVETTPIHEAMALLRRYLAGDRPAGTGAVLAVSGEHGTGKTHLAGQLVRTAWDEMGRDAVSVYVEARAGTFFTLYESLLNHFDSRELSRLVRGYYADIVADSLESTGFPTDVTRRLRAIDIDPDSFVEQFNLARSSYLAALRAKLTEVTGNADLAAALVLLLTRRELRDVIWKWLTGSAPDQLVRDHGVTSEIGTDADALDMTTAIMRLLGGRIRYFVLVLDDLEKSLPAAGPLPAETVAALGNLMEQATEHGVFLVLCGLPEFFATVDQDEGSPYAGRHIEAGRMSDDEVIAYIREQMPETHYGPGLGPFTEPIIRDITAIAGGNARRLILLCRRCYELAQDTERVTSEMVERAALSFQTVGRSVVVKRISDELVKQARQFFVNHSVGGDQTGPRVPYWVPAGDSGCAIFVTDSLTSADNARGLIESANAVEQAVPGARTMLIVNGFLSEQARSALEQRFTLPPLIYVAERFGMEFDQGLRRLVDQVEAGDRKQLETLRANMNRLATAQSSTQHFLEQVAFQVESMRTAIEQQYSALSRELRQLDRPDEQRPLPQDVNALFEAAVTNLKTLTGFDAALGEAFGLGAPGVAPQGAATVLLLRLKNADLVRAVGTALMAERVIDEFRKAVRDWHHRLGDHYQPRDSLPREQWETLEDLCYNYSTLIQNLPIHRLDDLAESPSAALGRSAVGAPVPARVAPADLFTTLSELGHNVREAFVPGAR